MCRTLAFLVAMMAFMPGCAGWRQAANKTSPSVDRQARAAEAIGQFEVHRDAAQYQAALDRCRQGDLAKAEALLGALVARRPQQAEARLRLAEILSSRGDPGAESHLLAVLAINESHAEAHHALGVYLDSVNRADEALQHFRRAAELEPQNEIYQTTLASRK